MKRILFSALVLSGVVAYAQTGKVGINTDSPNATLDVKAKTNDGSKVLELQNSEATKLVSVLDNGDVKMPMLSSHKNDYQLVVIEEDGLLARLTVTAEDEGKVLMVENGKLVFKELPTVSSGNGGGSNSGGSNSGGSNSGGSNGGGANYLIRCYYNNKGYAQGSIIYHNGIKRVCEDLDPSRDTRFGWNPPIK